MNYPALLAHFPKITYSRYKKLLTHFSNLEHAWHAELPELLQIGWEEGIIHEFIAWREKIEPQKIIETLAKETITTVSIGEKNYPEQLAHISDPPHTLFIRGTIPDAHAPSVAIVGTRNHTTYGKQAADEVTSSLAEQGIAIVSGLALGIDGVVHESVVRVHGKTIAVLGCGVDRDTVYPAVHRHLAERIIFQGGAIISEYPPGYKPTQYSFPARNRIIAGLTLATIVIEAAEESGALITAKCALDYNREVMAIPHPITSERGKGANNLIKQGAALITSAQDVMEILNLKNIKEIISNREILPSSPTEAIILQTLSKEPIHIDVIIKKTSLGSGVVMSTLTLMEMKGKIKNMGGMMYVIR
jgi:DNA processing protein